MKRKLIILLNGPSGAGKSTLSLALNKKLNPSFILSIDKRRGYLEQDRAKWPEIENQNFDIACGTIPVCLQKNICVIVEKVMLYPSWRKKLMALAKKHKASFYEFYLHAPQKDVLQRVGDRLGYSATWTKKHVHQLWDKMNAQEKSGIMIDTKKTSIQDAVDVVIKEIQKKR